MAISSYNTKFFCGASEASLSELIAIADFPDIGTEPNLLDATTLSDSMENKIFGINKSDIQQFTAYYDKTSYQKVVEQGYNSESEENPDKYYALVFSDGSGFTWKGLHQCGVSGAGVDEVIEAPIYMIFHSKPKWQTKVTVSGG